MPKSVTTSSTSDCDCREPSAGHRFGRGRDECADCHRLDVNKQARRRIKGHGSAVIWLTGVSGAGKSTIAKCLERRLHSLGVSTYLLDGDVLRRGLCKDLSFTLEDRAENIRRIAEVAGLMVDAGIVTIAALISPLRADRQIARDLFHNGEFIEVYVDTPLELAEERDVKGLYARARRGELKNFTGIDSPYEAPASPEIIISTALVEPEEAVILLLERLTELKVISRDWSIGVEDCI